MNSMYLSSGFNNFNIFCHSYFMYAFIHSPLFVTIFVVIKISFTYIEMQKS